MTTGGPTIRDIADMGGHLDGLARVRPVEAERWCCAGGFERVVRQLVLAITVSAGESDEAVYLPPTADCDDFSTMGPIVNEETVLRAVEETKEFPLVHGAIGVHDETEIEWIDEWGN